MINKGGEVGEMRKYIMGAVMRILCSYLSEWELENYSLYIVMWQLNARVVKQMLLCRGKANVFPRSQTVNSLGLLL
jgi:hypothetical protein